MIEPSYETSSTTTTTVVLYPVYPVVTNSPALLGWVQSVHANHQVILVGGVVSCLRCGSIVAYAARAFMLKKPCRGFVRQGGPSCRGVDSGLRQLSQGRLPHQLEEWPDELATPRDARPVYQLRHTGSEWVLGSQVTVVVSEPGCGRYRKGSSPAGPRRTVSWDPYFSNEGLIQAPQR